MLIGMVRGAFAVLSNSALRAEHDEWIRRNEGWSRLSRPWRAASPPKPARPQPGASSPIQRLRPRSRSSAPRIGSLVLIFAVIVAFAGGIYVADQTLPLRQEYGATFAKLPTAKATLLNVQLGARYSVRVTRVVDGDTVDARWPDGRITRVRLSDIDAPESCQEYGPEAAQTLSGMVLRKNVEVEVVDVDRNSRLVGRIRVGGTIVNHALAAAGAAWFYPEYAKDQTVYDIENEARDARRGLWALPASQRMEPWEHRRRFTCGK